MKQLNLPLIVCGKDFTEHATKLMTTFL